MSVLVDDNTGLEVTITGWLGGSPGVHSHAAVLAIWGSSEVGVVGARAVLSVADGEVVALTSLAVVVHLEVTGLLSETESVENVVVGVGGVEQLGDSKVLVLIWLHLLAVLVDKAELGAVWAVVVLPLLATAWVVLSSNVVTAGDGVVHLAVSVPGEWRASAGGVPWILDHGGLALSWIVETPGEDLVVSRGNVVDNVVDGLGLFGINIGEEPVVTDIGLNSPGEVELAILLDVNELGHWVGESTRGTLELEGLGLLHWHSLSALWLDWKLQGLDSTLEGLDGVREVTLSQWVGLWHLSLVEGVSEGEDLAITSNL